MKISIGNVIGFRQDKCFGVFTFYQLGNAIKKSQQSAFVGIDKKYFLIV